MEERDQTSMDMEVKTQKGGTYRKSIDTPRGFPQNPMTQEELRTLFRQCVDYGNKLWPPERIDSVLATIDRLEELSDIRTLINMFW
jgi:2-methylcitrate dehydratase PrpD